MSDAFTLKGAELPTVRRGSNKYLEVLQEFVKSGLKSAILGGYEAKSASVVVGIRKLAESTGAPVTVHQIAGEVYLKRAEPKAKPAE